MTTTTTWFTSDLHFGHKFLADLRGIGRERLNDHDEKIIEAWNDVVGAWDTVWVLGDFSFWKTSTGRTAEIFKELKGKKHLVIGNHDHSVTLALPWESQSNLHEIRMGEGEGHGRRLTLCHYPMLTWNKAHFGAWHLHGHTHGNLTGHYATGSTRMDVGIDCHPEGRPYSWDEIVAVLGEREYDYVDHHTAEAAAREVGSSGGGDLSDPALDLPSRPRLVQIPASTLGE